MLLGLVLEMNANLNEKALDGFSRGNRLSVKEKTPGRGQFSRGFTRELVVKNGGLEWLNSLLLTFNMPQCNMSRKLFKKYIKFNLRRWYNISKGYFSTGLVC